MENLIKCKLDYVREDDFVEYFLFPQLPDNLSAPSTPAAVDQLREHLETVLKECMTVVENRINEFGYMWHKDPFQLWVRTESAQERMLDDEREYSAANVLPPHLHGVTYYGDNIADEWFVVHLLYEVTRKVSGCIARIIDVDGEFLLIEAADVLPKWASPETCEQRAYIVNGKMQLVQNSPANTAKLLPVAAALEKIRLNPTLYCVSEDIEESIEDRIKEFKAQKNTLLHRQIVRLPVGVAALLRERPDLIAPSVRAFCERDPADLKACRTMRFFPPEQRVRTNVCFTQCLYSVLLHNDYIPDRKTGWNLSGATHTERYKEDLLGVKIACGFEILASRAKQLDADDTNDPTWRTYVRSLTGKGYFRNNLEGSEEYKRLLNEAKEYFKKNNERYRTQPVVGREILDLLNSININAEQLSEEQHNLQPSDSDSWLNITAEQLDAMIAARFNPAKLFKMNGDLNAEGFTKSVAEFLGKESGFDGIGDDSDDLEDAEDEEDDDDDDEDECAPKAAGKNKAAFKAKVKKNHSMRKACKRNSLIDVPEAKTGNISKTSDDESTHVRNFLDFVIPEDTWGSNSDMSDYEDDDDLARNFEAMARSEVNIDVDIKAYMAQMDKELAKTTIGQSFESTAGSSGRKTTTQQAGAEDDFDDIESFQPININVNTLKNMMDSYKSQVGGPGPVSNLLSAMGVGMSAAAAASAEEENNDLKESSV